ncbi:TIGR00730 family Rossman fold protein [Desulfobacter hydrogenophilus]|uniref:Cytokinin riboside 5'-monophosphate phosphoribohydrolase n=1 Tax=Desulfobacter hydrogenophilus TaxID=2291 RepID=A0A328FCD9_9BACT|nr:TIGR00730 family Rossman fold protein [Desulfobacter hydrogenophilus]NDY74036.1 TIGR00730 family Rossman fold protein [Desulfobacter hydrogenophilus]QBH15313.1 TIGR00730 family Rossman fold protein [Desulfobacter hydrogenophilus]RAM00783.1 TIGR00730 family Rossman fold protein [Desulfobacter hydrogenophilus]
MQKICVFCGSSDGGRPEYRQAAAALGHAMVVKDIDLVYGGGSVGLMGTLADTVLNGGGRVTGVIPEPLINREISHPGLTELVVVGSMHERKFMMADLSDGFIALPGGIGTMDELFEILSWSHLGIHKKPCALLNVVGYYDHLNAFMQHGVDQGFIRKEMETKLIIKEDPKALLDLFLDS